MILHMNSIRAFGGAKSDAHAFNNLHPKTFCSKLKVAFKRVLRR